MQEKSIHIHGAIATCMRALSMKLPRATAATLPPRWFAGMLVLLACTSGAMLGRGAVAAEMPLYPTGPDEDSSFIRFLNAGSRPIVVTSGKAKTTLGTDRPSTGYLPVAGGSKISGQLSLQGAKPKAVALQLAPGEFVTVVAIPGVDTLSTPLLREQPDDFNALKASLGFADLSAGACRQPGLQVAGRNVLLFEHASPGKVQRRLINPVALKVQLICAGKPQGLPLDLGRLQAGERYSVIVTPSGTGPKLMFANDQVAK